MRFLKKYETNSGYKKTSDLFHDCFEDICDEYGTDIIDLDIDYSDEELTESNLFLINLNSKFGPIDEYLVSVFDENYQLNEKLLSFLSDINGAMKRFNQLSKERSISLSFINLQTGYGCDISNEEINNIIDSTNIQFGILFDAQERPI